VYEGRNIKETVKEKYRLEMKKLEERIKLKGTERKNGDCPLDWPRAVELELNDMKTLFLYIWIYKTSALRPKSASF
jgi:hypothetical protein